MAVPVFFRAVKDGAEFRVNIPWPAVEAWREVATVSLFFAFYSVGCMSGAMELLS
jgi:hypothetical protein